MFTLLWKVQRPMALRGYQSLRLLTTSHVRSSSPSSFTSSKPTSHFLHELPPPPSHTTGLGLRKLNHSRAHRTNRATISQPFYAFWDAIFLHFNLALVHPALSGPNLEKLALHWIIYISYLYHGCSCKSNFWIFPTGIVRLSSLAFRRELHRISAFLAFPRQPPILQT